MSNENSGRRSWCAPLWSRQQMLACFAAHGDVADLPHGLDELRRADVCHAPLRTDWTPRNEGLACWYELARPTQHGERIGTGIGVVYALVGSDRLLLLGAGPRELATTGPAIAWLNELAPAGQTLTLAAAMEERPVVPRAVIGARFLELTAEDALTARQAARNWRSEWERHPNQGLEPELPDCSAVFFPDLALAALVPAARTASLEAFAKRLRAV